MSSNITPVYNCSIVTSVTWKYRPVRININTSTHFVILVTASHLTLLPEVQVSFTSTVNWMPSLLTVMLSAGVRGSERYLTGIAGCPWHANTPSMLSFSRNATAQLHVTSLRPKHGLCLTWTCVTVTLRYVERTVQELLFCKEPNRTRTRMQKKWKDLDQSQTILGTDRTATYALLSWLSRYCANAVVMARSLTVHVKYFTISPKL